jgi:hypothetical protein
MRRTIEARRAADGKPCCRRCGAVVGDVHGRRCPWWFNWPKGKMAEGDGLVTAEEARVVWAQRPSD